VDGFAYAVKAHTGKLIWKRDLGAKVTTSAAIRGRDLYLGTAKRHLYRLNIDSGEVLSDFATDATPNGHLIVADGSLLVFLGDEIFASFDLDLRKQRWSVEASKERTSARPYLWQGHVLAGNRRELTALATTDGTRVWSHQFPETVRGIGTSPEVRYVGSLKGSIFAYSPKP
jgi:outer membrane protein assembly factor BamB